MHDEGRSAARGIGRVILFAMDGAFSRSVYEHLRHRAPGCVVALVPWRDGAPGLPMVQVAGALSLFNEARRDGVALLPDDGTREWIGRLGNLEADFILVACYGARIEGKTREVARLGCLNLHPSLLPRYRGPAPVFWQLRHGEHHTGVTLHRLEDQLDAGPIAGRKKVILPDGASASDIDTLLGEAGAGLFVSAALAWNEVKFTPQNEQQASRQSFPNLADYRVSTDWTVLRAWNFMRAVGGIHSVFEIVDGSRLIRVRAPWGMTRHGARSDIADGDEGLVDLRFADGVLRAARVQRQG